MKRAGFFQVLVPGVIAFSLIGCTHVPTNIKNAFARQAESLAALERSLAEQDLAKGCNDSFTAAFEMEETLKTRGAAIQERVKKNFTDAMGRAQSFRDKGAPEKAAQKEAEAVQAMVEQTTQLQADLAKIRADVETEKGKCAEAMAMLQDMVHSLATAQAELDKFIQSDAKTPIEAFLFSFAETKALSRKVDEKAKMLETKMSGAADKLKLLENTVNAFKE